jgi:hypothetical protein
LEFSSYDKEARIFPKVEIQLGVARMLRTTLAAIASFVCTVTAIALLAIAEGGLAFFPDRLGYELLTSAKISPPNLDILPAKELAPNPLFIAVVTAPQQPKEIPSSDFRAIITDSPEADVGTDDGMATVSSARQGTTRASSDPTQLAPDGVHDEARPWLSLGSSGQGVIDLQTLLNASRSEVACRSPEMGCPLPLVVDGQFGPMTLARVQDFQRATALPPDGIVGPQTWKKLVTP